MLKFKILTVFHLTECLNDKFNKHRSSLGRKSGCECGRVLVFVVVDVN